MGNYLVKEIEDNMQIKLYNKLYNAREITDALNEPEHIAERRKELTALIKVMKNAQKIIRRDPDLMTSMQININDSDIATPAKDEKKDAKPEPAFKAPAKPEPVKTTPAATKPADKKKGGYGNLFG